MSYIKYVLTIVLYAVYNVYTYVYLLHRDLVLGLCSKH